MTASKLVAAAIWLLVVGGNVLNTFTISPRVFLSGPQLPWQIVFMPIIVVVGAFSRRGQPGEIMLRRWVDDRFGQGVYSEFMGWLRLELLFAAMCLGIVLSALARAFFLKTLVLPPTIVGFFASGSVAFLVAYYVRRTRRNVTAVRSSMSGPTPL